MSSEVEHAVDGIIICLEEVFEEHRTTGSRQNIVAGIVSWLVDENGADMSPGEVRSAIRKADPVILDYTI